MLHDGAPIESPEAAGHSPETGTEVRGSGGIVAVPAFVRDLTLLADRAASWAGEADIFLWFLEEFAEVCVRNPGFADRLPAAPEIPATLRGAIVESGGRALRDAQSAGLVRADLEADDILTIASLLGAGLSGDIAERRAISLRTRKIVLSGVMAEREPPG